ncbi:MAG TPA: hypothetical protein DCY13_11045 [Verrucomicrobiales bacterium]|nr:hypothetical protein [Verrucomicrobiales bacterium]
MDFLKDLQIRLAKLPAAGRSALEAGDRQTLQQLANNLDAELARLRDERRHVMAENLELAARVKVLEQEVARMKAAGMAIPEAPAEFVEHQGALFKREASGRFHDRPHCRNCRRPMRMIAADLPFTCGTCRVSSFFKASELNDILVFLRRS